MMKPSSTDVVVVGMGYVGLTLASVLARTGFRVHGVEKRPDVVDSLREKLVHLVEPGVEEAVRDHMGRNWTVSAVLPPRVDVAIICVSTPVDVDGVPNLTNLRDAARALGEIVHDDTLVIVRSTVPVGTTREIVAPLLERGGRKVKLAFCPERTIQGIALREIVELPQVVGARDEASHAAARAFFDHFVSRIVPVSSLEAAELVKLINNCHTDLIYSYGNVVARMALQRDLDPLEVIEAANLDYPRPKLARPGFVGGACLTKDPYILLQSFEGTDGEPHIVRAVRQLNESMPTWVARHFTRLLCAAGKKPHTGRVLVCGYAYKGVPETDDMRGTPVTSVLEELKQHWQNIRGQDFVVDPANITALGTAPTTMDEGMSGADGVLILNDHPAYKGVDMESLVLKASAPVVVYDCWRVFRGREFTRHPNVVYAGIGYEA